MSRNSAGSPTSRRALIIVAAFAGWLALLLVAAGRPVRTEFWIGLPDLSNLVTVIWLIALVAGTILLITAPKKGPMPSPQETRRSRWVIWVFLGLVLLITVVNPDILDGLRLDPEDTIELETPGPVEVEEDEDLPPPDIQIDASDVYILLTVLAVAGLLARWNRRRAAAEEPALQADEANDLTDQLSEVVERMQFELLQEGEPRARVMAAYAEVEQALARQKLPRRHTETASEHLSRTLESIAIDPQPLVAIGRLYERARYSSHTITSADQQQAAEALRRTQDELVSLTASASSRPDQSDVNGASR